MEHMAGVYRFPQDYLIIDYTRKLLLLCVRKKYIVFTGY